MLLYVSIPSSADSWKELYVSVWLDLLRGKRGEYELLEDTSLLKNNRLLDYCSDGVIYQQTAFFLELFCFNLIVY